MSTSFQRPAVVSPVDRVTGLGVAAWRVARLTNHTFRSGVFRIAGAVVVIQGLQDTGQGTPFPADLTVIGLASTPVVDLLRWGLLLTGWVLALFLVVTGLALVVLGGWSGRWRLMQYERVLRRGRRAGRGAYPGGPRTLRGNAVRKDPR